ncbi:MAG: flagellar biosynthetic protein FliO [Pseudomonadota bacterium]
MFNRLTNVCSLTLGLCCAPVVVFAEDKNFADALDHSVAFNTADPLSAESLLRLFGGLVLVLVLVVALIWILKRVQGIPSGSAGDIQILGALALGQKERLVVVRLGHEQIVVGVTPGRIDHIHTLHTPLEAPTQISQDSSSFAEKLRSVIGKGGQA